MKQYEDFTGLYQISKTLRFEARPIGKTYENILKNGLIDRDEHRSRSYVQIKKLIDEYHKAFIDNALEDGCLCKETSNGSDMLNEYFELYLRNSKSDSEQKRLEKLQEQMRKDIVKRLSSQPGYKHLFKQELIQAYKIEGSKDKSEADLIKFVKGSKQECIASLTKEEAVDLIHEFRGFTTYFNGFHENRANLYSEEAKSTAIAYRLINENLPKFIDNIIAFRKIIEIPEMQEAMRTLCKEMEPYLNVKEISEMFIIDYYDMLLTQKQIDVYNAIIGGRVDETCDTHIKGINQYVNLYNQQHKETKLPKLKVLYKQILSDRNAISWLPEEFHNDKEVLEAIKDCYARLTGNILGEKILKSLLTSLEDYDLNGIYIPNDQQLTDISQRIFGNWSEIQNAILGNIKEATPKKKKESDESYSERLNTLYKKQTSFSIHYINECLSAQGEEDGKTIQSYFANCGAIDTPTMQRENLFSYISNMYTDAKRVLDGNFSNSLAQDKEAVEKIKNLLDSIKEMQHFIKPLLGSGKETDKDERFSAEFDSIWRELDTITPLYNMVRNYMTRKPYSQEKIKLNFDNPQLLGGWDANKEQDYSSIILRRGVNYYLAIMDKDSRNLLGKAMPSAGECYEKMVYKLLPGANKMLPKVFFSKSRKEEFAPSQQIEDIRDNGSYKKGSNFNIEDCHQLIDFYKQSILKHEDWSKFGFQFSPTSSYQDINEFFNEVEQQGYGISFTKVSIEFIDQLVDEGKLYLFQIYNKDFSKYSKGTPNMHTLYWRALFDEKNLADVIYKLNGQSELFYRKKSLERNEPTHRAHEPIKNKNKNNPKSESVFDYDLIKDKRYTLDKFMLHIPITMNFKCPDRINLNNQVKEYLQEAEDTHVIGIDRGERHLLYLVVIDRYGNIKEQFSLNDIVNEYNGIKYQTDYHALLDTKEKERKEARKSWQTIESIKELKEGYLSQVIHKITQLMIKYHAIVVLEDLNRGFMRGRQKVEKEVYRKFEKMLIDKLNYLVDKRAEPEAAGGLMRAYQLTSKFESFEKLGKQSGFLFYVPAWNTSKIDPVTGFVNLFDTHYKSIDSAKKFFSSFDSIRYEAEKGWFEFRFDYRNFGTKADGTRTVWTLCTRGSRIETFRNPDKNSQWDNQEIDLTSAIKSHLESYGINLSSNLKDGICSQSDKRFFEVLLYYLKLTLQMRNSITGTNVDYLVSPVSNENGNYFDSRTSGEILPQNADANGAYNIARKGLMLIDQIKQSDDVTGLKFDLSNKNWLKFAQEKPYLDD